MNAATVYAALVAAGVPLYGHFLDWPRFLRHLHEDPHRARMREYAESIALQWALAAVGFFFWQSELWDAPVGWRAWAAAVPIVLLAATQVTNIVKAIRSERTRTWLREHMAHVEPILPVTDSEFAGFLTLSITAGICEEFSRANSALTTRVYSSDGSQMPPRDSRTSPCSSHRISSTVS